MGSFASRPVRISWPMVTRIGNLVATILLLAVGILALGDDVPARTARDWATEGPFREQPVGMSSDADPDIYLILLDGYLRPDRQKLLFGHDVSDFVGALQRRRLHRR